MGLKYLNLKNICNCRNRIIQKRIDYWTAYKKGYDDYLTEIGIRCSRVGMWDIYLEHFRRRGLVIKLICKLHNLKKR